MGLCCFPEQEVPMHRSRRPLAAGLAVLASALIPLVAAAQTDAIPADQLGVWVPEKKDCKSPLRVELAPKQITLVNGTDRASQGNVGLTYSYVGASYQGISFVVMADWDKKQPYLLTFNEGEKKGRTKVSFTDAGLKKRFPLEQVALKRCPPPPKPAGK
jgi:hypothetical protein